MNLVSVFELLVFPHMTVDDGETTNLMWHLVDNHNIITKETCDKYISRVEYEIAVDYEYNENDDIYNVNLCNKEEFLVSFQCKSRSHPTHLGSRAWRYNHICIDDKI